MTAIVLELAIRVVSELNAHTHWRRRQKRAAEQRAAARLALTQRLAGKPRPKLPLVVLLTRIAPRELDDDNAVGAQKHVRDGIADALGINDRDKRVLWLYRQTKGAPKQYGVRVEIRDDVPLELERVDCAH